MKKIVSTIVVLSLFMTMGQAQGASRDVSPEEVLALEAMERLFACLETNAKLDDGVSDVASMGHVLVGLCRKEITYCAEQVAARTRARMKITTITDEQTAYSRASMENSAFIEGQKIILERRKARGKLPSKKTKP